MNVADAPPSSILRTLAIDGRPIGDRNADEARQVARRKIAEGEALIAFAKAVEAATRLERLK